MNDLNRHVTYFLEQHPVKRCLIACSGGVDSMVLLDLLRKSGKELLVLHVNYGLRGEASDLDETLIADYCRKHQLSFKSKRLDLYEVLKSEGGNLQNKARDIRYGFFKRFLLEGDGIFMAHHLDDQIETFLMALSRGGGIRALSCMAEKRLPFYRPLLSFSKAELISYAQTNNVVWREDHSNQELSYARNKWRNIFLPELRKAFPEIGTDVQILIKQVQLQLQDIQSKAKILLSDFRVNGIIPFHWLDVEAGEAAKELLRITGFSHGVYDELIKLRNSEKGARIGIDHTDFKLVFREAEYFRFLSDTIKEIPELHIQSIIQLPEIFDKHTLYLNPDKITGQLRIRTWQNGDRIKPIGLVGSKLISDILTDAKVPTSQKSSQLVVHDAEKILWCIGFAISREALATPSSRKLKVEVK